MWVEAVIRCENDYVTGRRKVRSFIKKTHHKDEGIHALRIVNVIV